MVYNTLPYVGSQLVRNADDPYGHGEREHEKAISVKDLHQLNLKWNKVVLHH